MQISPHCYAVTGLACFAPWSVNAGFVVGDVSTLIVDTGFNRLSAQTIVGYARAVRPSNRLVAINTEQHFDHILGNHYLLEQQIEVFGHASIARSEEELLGMKEEYALSILDRERRMLREEEVFFAGCPVANPSHPLPEETTIDLGGITAEILFTPGHTPSNLSVWVPADRVVFTGDAVVDGYAPNLTSGNPEAWRLWIESLERIEGLEAAVVVPGHGDVLEGSAIERAIEHVRALLVVSC